jgi:hypothetical protein
VIKAVSWYARRETLPRIRSIVVSGGTFIAVVIGILAGRLGAQFIPASTTVGSLAIAFLTYAAIALGFSLAGLTLALTLPNDKFVQLLCGTRAPEKTHDAYSDLLFVFSWTAIVHWLLVVVSVLLVLLVNPSQPAFEVGLHRLKVGLVSGLVVYCLLQFLVTLITLSQVGTVYIRHLQGQIKPQESPATSKHVQ